MIPDNKEILIVGGRTGISENLLKKLCETGASVTCATRNVDALPDMGQRTIAYDACAPSSLELPERLDGVVYCPGTISLKPFQRLTREDFQQDMNVNFYGAVDILQQCFKSLKKSPSASVVLFSTVAVQTGMGFHASIASAKGAVEGLTRSLAAEWAPKVRVNAIAPSLTNTPLAASILSSEEKIAAAKQRHPSKSIGDLEDIASLVMFLLSEQSKFMTGQILGMDGGMSSIKTF
jgi:NAD(P)-dependent dehydrogenase (short-subunit alcohol dehydrogenase family)